MIRVLVTAPTLAVRTGLRALLEADPELEVAAEAQTLDDPEALLEEVDVVVLAGVDLQPEALEGALETLGVILLSDDPRAGSFLAGLTRQAWGLLTPDASAEELAAAVRAVFEGLLVGPPALLAPLLEQGALPETLPEPAGDLLTEREVEVLALLAQGLANKQIAGALGISEHTVKFHVSSIYSKLGATNRAEAVRLGARLGLIAL